MRINKLFNKKIIYCEEPQQFLDELVLQLMRSDFDAYSLPFGGIMSKEYLLKGITYRSKENVE